MPNLRSGRRGALLIQVIIEIPTKVDRQQEKLLREYAELERKDVLPEQKKFFDKLKDLFSGEEEG